MQSVIENHTAKAASTLVIVIGFFMDFIQRAAPELQRLLPDIKWISPLAMLIGGIWLFIQRMLDARKQ